MESNKKDRDTNVYNRALLIESQVYSNETCIAVITLMEGISKQKARRNVGSSNGASIRPRIPKDAFKNA